MSTNTTKLFVEFDRKELVFVVSNLDEKKFKILHSINLPLNPVAYSIFTPPIFTGSILTLGFK